MNDMRLHVCLHVHGVICVASMVKMPTTQITGGVSQMHSPTFDTCDVARRRTQTRIKWHERQGRKREDWPVLIRRIHLLDSRWNDGDS